MTNPDTRTPRRGEIYWLDWNPARGSEQAGRRPALIVQENAASANPNYPLTIVAAVSTKGRQIPTHIEVARSEWNGLEQLSFVKCEQLQTVTKARLGPRIGELEAEHMAQVNDALKKVFALT